MSYAGALIYNGSLQFSEGTAQLNMNSAVPGIYLVVLRDSAGVSNTFRLVIQ